MPPNLQDGVYLVERFAQCVLSKANITRPLEMHLPGAAPCSLPWFLKCLDLSCLSAQYAQQHCEGGVWGNDFGNVKKLNIKNGIEERMTSNYNK